MVQMTMMMMKRHRAIVIEIKVRIIITVDPFNNNLIKLMKRGTNNLVTKEVSIKKLKLNSNSNSNSNKNFITNKTYLRNHLTKSKSN